MDNYSRMQLRAFYANNDRQHDRMVKDKLRTFHRVLLYSYQRAWIKKDGDDEAVWVRSLINPDKVKFDYDEKILSVDFEHGFKPGDSFEWKGTGTHWIILKQELTELAYFRGSIRRAQALEATDPETGEKETLWVAMRGPVETKINSIQKAGIVADLPNLTLAFYVADTPENRAKFERYQRFAFDGRYWMVQAPDGISTPGILEVTAKEDYECHGDEFLFEVQDPNPPVAPNEDAIIGDTFIKPLTTAIYTAATSSTFGYDWVVSLPSENKDVEDVLDWKVDGNTITIKWTAMVSGSFILQYGPLERTIVVESLF